MRIGLIDVDRTGFPNLALMKISAYHKQQGDNVEWADPLFGKYDRIYKSKIFTFTEDDHDIYNCEVIKGGTGYDITSKLPKEIDNMQPDYSIYNVVGISYGFLTRGCINKCPWCIVPIKEGKITPYNDIDNVAAGNKKIILMDNNILASEYGLSQLEKIANRGYKVDFNQGIDARLINDEVAKLLAKIKWLYYIRMACDSRAQIEPLIKAHSLLEKYGYRKEIFCYFLINDWQDANERIKALRHYKWFTPFGQPYRNFNDSGHYIPKWQKDMARWMNRKWLYKNCEFKDYEPRKNFKCEEYYNDVNLLCK